MSRLTRATRVLRTDRRGSIGGFAYPSRAVSFTDNCLGPQTFVAGQHFGDFVVFGKDNFAAYELAWLWTTLR